MWTGSPRVCCAPDTLRGASSDLFPRAGTSVAQRQPWRAALRLEEVPKKSPSSLDAGPSAPAATSHVPQGRWRLRTRPHSPPGAHAPLWLLADAAVGGGRRHWAAGPQPSGDTVVRRCPRLGLAAAAST